MNTIELVVTKEVETTLGEALSPYRGAPVVDAWLKSGETLRAFPAIEDALCASDDRCDPVFGCNYPRPAGFSTIVHTTRSGKASVEFTAPRINCMDMDSHTVGVATHTLRYQVDADDEGRFAGFSGTSIKDIAGNDDIKRVAVFALTNAQLSVLRCVLDGVNVKDIPFLTQPGMVSPEYLEGLIPSYRSKVDELYCVVGGKTYLLREGRMPVETQLERGFEFEDMDEFSPEFLFAAVTADPELFWEICPDDQTLASAVAWAKKRGLTPPSFRPDYLDE